MARAIRTSAERVNKAMTLNIPRPYLFLLEPAPYKIAYGGRYSTKDWSYARALLLLAGLYTSNLADVQVDEVVKKFTELYKIDGALIRKSIISPHRILCTRLS